jgi:hypothetical protein
VLSVPVVTGGTTEALDEVAPADVGWNRGHDEVNLLGAHVDPGARDPEVWAVVAQGGPIISVQKATASSTSGTLSET